MDDLIDDLMFINATLYIDATEDGDLDDLFAFLRQDDLPQLITLTVILCVLFVVGCVGNTLVLAVFYLSMIKQTSTYLIAALAFTDLIVVTVAIPGVLINNWSYPFKLDALCKTWELVRMTTVPMSALILMAIAFDRYFLICVKSYRNKSKAFLKFTAASVLTCSIGLGIPPMMAVGVYQKESGDVVKYLGLCMPNFLLIKPKVLADYWKFVTALMSVILVTVITLYVMVFIKVYKQSYKWNSFRQNKVQATEIKLRKIKHSDTGHDQRCLMSINCPNETNLRCKTTKQSLVENKQRQQKTMLGLHENKMILHHRDPDGLAQTKSPQIFLIKVDSHKKTELCNNTMTLRQGKTNHMNLYQEKLNPISEDRVDDSGQSSNEEPQTGDSEKQDDENKCETEAQEKVTQHQTSNLGRHRAHIKTAKVLIVVTILYFASYCPTFLMSCDVISDDNLFLFYSYFLHCAANPIIYSFMNKQFRHAVKKMLSCHKRNLTRIPRH